MKFISYPIFLEHLSLQIGLNKTDLLSVSTRPELHKLESIHGLCYSCKHIIYVVSFFLLICVVSISNKGWWILFKKLKVNGSNIVYKHGVECNEWHNLLIFRDLRFYERDTYKYDFGSVCYRLK